MIDTHAHLDAGGVPAETAIERARAAGVRRIVAVGSGIASCRAALELAARHGGVFAALGIHPHQAGEVTEDDLAALESLLGQPGAVAVGETGLDYYRDFAPRDRQAALFGAQRDLAIAHDKALVIHTRAADADTLGALEAVREKVPVILHCFSSAGLLPAALERGYYVSFAGNVTFPKAADLRRAASCVPDDRLLAETDSPYLAPQRVRGRPNEPAYVLDVLSTLAEVRGEQPEELERRIDENATRAFGLP